jgi:hypothetical protein
MAAAWRAVPHPGWHGDLELATTCALHLDEGHTVILAGHRLYYTYQIFPYRTEWGGDNDGTRPSSACTTIDWPVYAPAGQVT